jgi:uncharacterized protein YndB with AHSA1/START domain
MPSARIDRTYDVDIATMWALWTDPQHLAQWFKPSLASFGPTIASLQPRAGTTYRIEMIRTDGEVHAVTGTVLAAEEPTNLALTWRWDGTDHESLVEVTLSERDGKTTVVIEHSRLADDEDVARHEAGWVGCLASLAGSR